MTTKIQALLSEDYQSTHISPLLLDQIEVSIQHQYSFENEVSDPIIYLSTLDDNDDKTIAVSIGKEELIYLAEAILKHYK